MKTLRYPLGHPQYKTMTAGELRDKLSNYPDDMAVLATWEGIHTSFDPECFSVDNIDHVHPDDIQDCLVIDVEYAV